MLVGLAWLAGILLFPTGTTKTAGRAVLVEEAMDKFKITAQRDVYARNSRLGFNIDEIAFCKKTGNYSHLLRGMPVIIEVGTEDFGWFKFEDHLKAVVPARLKETEGRYWWVTIEEIKALHHGVEDLMEGRPANMDFACYRNRSLERENDPLLNVQAANEDRDRKVAA